MKKKVFTFSQFTIITEKCKIIIICLKKWLNISINDQKDEFDNIINNYNDSQGENIHVETNQQWTVSKSVTM